MARRRMLEHSLQIAVAHMLDVVLDPLHTWHTAIDHGVGKLGFVEAGIRKRRGVRAGIPDFIILTNGWQVLGLELKAGKGKLSDAQQLVCSEWLRLGHGYYVVRSLPDVQRVLEAWGVPLRRRMTFFGGGHERAQRPAATRHPRPRRTRKPKGAVPLVLRHQAKKD